MASVVAELSKAFVEFNVTVREDDSLKSIVLYNGPGAAADCVRLTKLAITCILNTPVQLVDASFFQRTDWIKNTKLIVIPGGLSTFTIRQALGTIGMQNLYTAICLHKVPYLGICAGAILVSSFFELNNVTYKTPTPPYTFPLFQGTATIPIPQRGYAANAQGSVEMVRRIILGDGSSGISGYCFYKDGPGFLDALQHKNVEILGRYVTDSTKPLEMQPPALIHCTDIGNAVLCGPHPEFSRLSDDISITRQSFLRPAFLQTTFETMFAALGLLKKKPCTVADFTGIETLTTHAQHIIYSYLEQPFGVAPQNVPFVKHLPSFQAMQISDLVNRLQTLRDRLIRVVALEFTLQSPTPHGDRLLETLSYGEDYNMFALFKFLQHPHHEKETLLKISTIIEKCLQTVIPDSQRYEKLEKYAQLKEQFPSKSCMLTIRLLNT
jgi:glutamine amidotransferase-like uncharacterized protein